MNTLEMIKFGRTLTDREYGKSVASSILKDCTFPLLLDFKNVISLGSSCGDEILNAIGKHQENKVTIINANAAVKNCLEKVSKDSKVSIDFR